MGGSKSAKLGRSGTGGESETRKLLGQRIEQFYDKFCDDPNPSARNDYVKRQIALADAFFGYFCRHAWAATFEIVNGHGLAKCDPEPQDGSLLAVADLHRVVDGKNTVVIGYGESSDVNGGDNDTRAEQAAKNSLNDPLFQMSLAGAKSALIMMASGKDADEMHEEIVRVKSVVKEKLPPTVSRNLILGTDKNLKEKIRVMALIAGE